jgi:hypothetical protein
MSNTYTFWNFAGDHPILLFFCVYLICCTVETVSENVVQGISGVGKRG